MSEFLSKWIFIHSKFEITDFIQNKQKIKKKVERPREAPIELCIYFDVK